MTALNIQTADKLIHSSFFPHTPTISDSKLQEAFQNCDISKIKDALFQGADAKTAHICPRDLEFVAAALELSLKNDPESMRKTTLWICSIFGDEGVDLSDDDNEDFCELDPSRFLANVHRRIDEGYTFSEEFNHSIITVVKDLLLLGLDDQLFNEIFEDTPDTLSLFEFSLLIKDLELLQILLDQGQKPSVKEWSLFDVFDSSSFTLKNIEILELLESYGYQLEELLEEDETIESVLESAYDDECSLLIDFLEKRGYRLRFIPEYDNKAFLHAQKA